MNDLTQIFDETTLKRLENINLTFKIKLYLPLHLLLMSLPTVNLIHLPSVERQ